MLKEIGDKLNLSTALRLAESNDMLPPREDDKVSGELGKRFVEHLKKRIDEDLYEPDPASFVQVPKPGFTSRPAALLTLADRVVYESIVSIIRPRLVKYLIEEDVVLWPREGYIRKRWREFENAPLNSECSYIVQADISGFYESIDHSQLNDDIVSATGERVTANALQQFLTKVMCSRRGIPQGLLPSDTLATLFLQPVDAAMLREDFKYWRHGDDIRIACRNMSRARESISILEDELRKRGLLINSSKVAILKKNQYDDHLKSGEKSVEYIKNKIFARNVTKVSASQKTLTAAMERAQLDEQWGWNLFYHNTISIDDVINEIREHLMPNEVEVAEHAFNEAVSRAPGNENAYTKEQFHYLITKSMIRLPAARSPVALDHAAPIIAKFPDKTELVCQYLQAVQGSHSKQVVAVVDNIVSSTLFKTPWQLAWLYRVLDQNAYRFSDRLFNRLNQSAHNQSVHWLTRVEAMKVLARLNSIPRELVTSSWSLAPRCYRSDLIAVVARVYKTQDWARRFLQATRLDPIETVITKHLLNDIVNPG